MSGVAGPSKKPKNYHFHPEWELDFFFTMSFSKCVCLICQTTVALPKKGNVARHFRTLHGKYDIDFPPDSELRKREVNELKSLLPKEQPFFSHHTSKAKAVTDILLWSSVVQLNVGGHLFSTFLSTLRKHPESKLAEMFNGPPKLPADAEGYYFIDRDGSNFRAILDFLRTDQLPTNNIREIHKEAVYYNIKPLIKGLEEAPHLFGELVGRQQFLARVPHYKENIEVLIRVARAEAVAARHSTILICVLQTEEDLGSYNDAINNLEADKESVVTFGPWKAAPSVQDLLDCIQMDIENQGYKVTIKRHVMEKSFLSRSYDYFYKVILTWW